MTRRSHVAAVIVGAGLMVSGTVPVTPGDLTAQAPRPNIVLMFPDNLGWGEVGVYGSVRGLPTPHIDSSPPKASASTTSTSSSRARSRARR